jgi:transposase-like protein
VDDQLIDELVSRTQAEGLQLTGEGGLLQKLTKRLLESVLEGEITDHLGYDKHDPAGKDGGQLPQRQTLQDRADRRGAGGNSRAPRPGRLLRAEGSQ